EPGSGGHDRHAASGTTTLTVPTGRIACAGCRAIVAERLRANPHVLAVHVDDAHQVAHVTVHDGAATAEELAELVAGAYGERSPIPLPKPEVSAHAHAHAPAGEHAAMGHGAHDMSDPRMAAAMEADMRRRFWISLVLSLPVVAYSSLGMLLGLRPP